MRSFNEYGYVTVPAREVNQAINEAHAAGKTVVMVNQIALTPDDLVTFTYFPRPVRHRSWWKRLLEWRKR